MSDHIVDGTAMTGLVEEGAIALMKDATPWMEWADLNVGSRGFYLRQYRAVLTALLPHLSDESRKIIEEALRDE